MKLRHALFAIVPFLVASTNIKAFGQLADPGDLEEFGSGNPDVIAVDPDLHKRMTVPVSINGSGPYNFMIDTGSERTILSFDVASQLALERLPGARIVGVAGIKSVDMAYVPELQLGKRTYSGLETPLLLDRNMGADGILGLDGLQSQQVFFNFKDSSISILDAKTRQRALDGEEIVVTARRKSGQLIFTNAKIDGVRVDVVIDTGAHTSIGNLALRKKMYSGRKNDVLYKTKLFSVTGQSIDADMILARKLNLDRLYIPNFAIAFADVPAFESLGLNERPALLLGMDVLRLFDGVSINFANRKVSFFLRDEVSLRRAYAGKFKQSLVKEI